MLSLCLPPGHRVDDGDPERQELCRAVEAERDAGRMLELLLHVGAGARGMNGMVE